MGTGVPGQGCGHGSSGLQDAATRWCWGHGDGVDMGCHGDTQGDKEAVGQGGGVARCGDSGCGDSGHGDSGCGHWAAPTTRHPADAGGWRGEEGPWTWWRCPRPQGGGGLMGGGSHPVPQGHPLPLPGRGCQRAAPRWPAPSYPPQPSVSAGTSCACAARAAAVPLHRGQGWGLCGGPQGGITPKCAPPRSPSLTHQSVPRWGPSAGA